MRAWVVLLVLAVSATGQVRSAADAQAGLYTGPVAPGSMATLDLACCILAAQPNPVISLRPAGSGKAIPATVLSANNARVNFLVPAELPPGDVQVIYKSAEQPTHWATATVAPAAFALFRSGLTGPPLAQNISAGGVVSAMGLANPAQPGQAVVLWGTGLGSTPKESVRVTVGGVAQTVLYAGSAPGQPGVDQINFRIAPQTPDGCYVPFARRLRG